MTRLSRNSGVIWLAGSMPSNGNQALGEFFTPLEKTKQANSWFVGKWTLPYPLMLEIHSTLPINSQSLRKLSSCLTAIQGAIFGVKYSYKGTKQGKGCDALQYRNRSYVE